MYPATKPWQSTFPQSADHISDVCTENKNSCIADVFQLLLGRGSGSRSTENTGKYRSSGSRNTENLNTEIFNITESRKMSSTEVQ